MPQDCPVTQTFLPIQEQQAGGRNQEKNGKQRKVALETSTAASVIALEVWNLGAVGETSGHDQCFISLAAGK